MMASTAHVLSSVMGRLAWRRRQQRILNATCPWLTVGLLTGAASMVMVRLLVPGGHEVGYVVLGAGLIAPLFPLVMAWRIRDPHWVLAGHVDQLAGTNGLVMGQAEQALPGWEAYTLTPLQGLRLPPLQLTGVLWPILASLLVLLALALPQRQAAPPISGLAAQAVAAPILHQGQALAATLPPLEAERLRQQLTLLQSATAGLDPAGWEALDRVAKEINAVKTQQSQRVAQALAAAAMAQQPGNSPADIEAAAGELVLALAAVNSHVPLPTMSPELQNALAQAAALAPAGGANAALTELLRKSASGANAPNPGAGVDPAALAALGNWAQESLQAWRSANGIPLTGPETADGNQLGTGNGTGQANRGPGHTSLEQTPREAFPLGNAEGLPQGTRLNPDGSITIAESIRDPSTDERVVAAQQAQVGVIDNNNADARTNRIAPRHQAAVAAYFLPTTP